ncbi:ATP-binding protein [Candidatus Woesearchaeota archaeon]|nr:ATP-binding protein [Candidatus Woesearchaeota archaeon]
MLKGQVVSGDFGKIVMRVKANESVELGELLVIDDHDESVLLQVYDLTYGSQISPQNLEMVSGINLEEGNFQLMDEALRNYQLAFLKPVLNISKNQLSKSCKKLPTFFTKVRAIQKEDLFFITTPANPLFLGKLRSGSKEMDADLFLPGKEVLRNHVLIPASTGKGKSNLMSCILWDIVGKDYAGMLILDPHDEYYGRVGLGLKDHSQRHKVSYYTPHSPPPGAGSLKVNLKLLKPEHFQGVITLSDPQRQMLYAYHKKFESSWIYNILAEKQIQGVTFHEDTIAVVKRKLVSLLGLEIENGRVYCQGVFDDIAGENILNEICLDLEHGKIVIIDTSYFSGAIEILIGGMITTEILEHYKYYKRTGILDEKPVVSIVLEEAPRVLGKNVLEQGSNIFETIAREGRKFKVGLIAITQLPSEIPKNILANINTKIILGLEMSSERQAVIESSPQDLSQDSRNIAALDKGEALVTSIFTKFAVPVKVPLFKEFVQKNKAEKVQQSFTGISLS